MADSLVATLHDCPGSVDAWTHFLERLSDTFDSKFAGLMKWSQAAQSEVSLSVGLDAAAVALYHRHYASVNPWIIEGARTFRDGVALPTEAFVPDSRLVRSEFFNDFGRHHEGRYGVAAQVQSGSYTLHVSLARSHRRGPFDASELRRITNLLPYVRSAIAADRYAAQLRAEGAVTAESLDRVSSAVVVLDRPPHLNAEARQLFVRWPGVFSIVNDSLRIRNPRCNAALQRRVQQATTAWLPVDQPFAIRVRPDVAFHIDVVAGFAGTQWARTRPPIVVIRQGPSITLLQQALALRFRLTARERDLVTTFARTASVHEAAIRLGMATSTARLHLARVFQKTGLHSQGALLDLVDRLSSPGGSDA